MNIEIKVLGNEDLVDKSYEKSIIIKDAGSDLNMVRITIGDKTVKVYGTEMIKAIERCTHAQWPY